MAESFLLPRKDLLGRTHGDVDEIDRDGNMIARSILRTLPAQHPKHDFITCLTADTYVLPSASLVARHAFDAVRVFDKTLSGYEDNDRFLSRRSRNQNGQAYPTAVRENSDDPPIHIRPILPAPAGAKDKSPMGPGHCGTPGFAPRVLNSKGFLRRTCRESGGKGLRLLRAGYDNIFPDRPVTKRRVHSGIESHSHRMALSRMVRRLAAGWALTG